MLKSWNTTFIALVPIVDSPTTVKELTHCLGSVHYKCITKVLANRLKSFLPYIINKNQSAFMKGRSIIDNVLLM